jgi:hypothetical protein
VQPADEDPDPSGDHLVVEFVDGAVHGCVPDGGWVVVVRVMDRDETLPQNAP